MELINKIKEQFNSANQKLAMYLASGGIQDLYKKIFITRQYPIFFFLQATWCAFVVRTTHRYKKQTIVSKLLQLITAFLMCFSSREVMAFIFHEKSPLLARPDTALLFLGIWILINFSPFDIVYKLLNLVSIVFCPAQCANQVRILIRIESRLKKNSIIPQPYRLPFILLIVNFEFLVERVMSVITSSSTSSLSNPLTILLTSAGIYLYKSATSFTPLTKYIGRYDQKLSALVLFVGLALITQLRRSLELSAGISKPCQVQCDNNENKERARNLYHKEANLKNVSINTD
jgi:hypothetical protein